MTYIIDTTIDKHLDKVLKEKNTLEREGHVASGKLTASMLGQPLQWQILKVLGVPPKPMENYVLRKLQRGKDVENWLVENLPGLIDTQKLVDYRNCIGLVDALVDTSSFGYPCGIIPHEIKSVTNAKYKRIMEEGNADHGHILQACLYALGTKSEHFAVVYVASDDYRVHTMVYDTKHYKSEVDEIIDRFDKQLATGVVPEFVAVEPWQKNPNYNSYPDWVNLSSQEATTQYLQLLSFKKGD